MDPMLILVLFIQGTMLIVVGLQLFCVWRALRHALHMYQQHAYQNPSHKKWLAENQRLLLGRNRLLPMLFCLFSITASDPRLMGLSMAGSGLFIYYNRNVRAAKKPLVYTARVKRLMATAAIITLPLFATATYVWMAKGISVESGVAAVAMCGWVLAQPWLVMLYAAINSPIERAINRRYVEEARRMVQGSRDLTVIGITGSYGKTSTKTYLEQLLAVQYHVYSTPGNFNTTLGVVRAVREGLRPTHQVFLCEMGARHRGDIAEICDLVQPKMGILTAIGGQHLETFGSQKAITETKLELARAVEAKGGQIFVNWGSEIAAAQTYTGALCRYGTVAGSDYQATDITVSAQGSAFTVTTPGGDSARFETRLLGDANVENITGAIAVAHSMGIVLNQLVPAVRGLKGAPHRLELKQAGDLTLIDDAYNSNPQGARNALQTLARCAGSRVLVTPGLVELGAQEEPENRALGALAASHADYVVVVGKKPGGFVAAGAMDAGLDGDKLHRAATIEAALEHVRGLEMPDKIVLLLNDLPDSYS